MKKMNIIIFSLFLFTHFAFAEYEIYMERGMVKVDEIVSSIKNENGLMTITIIDNGVTDVCPNVKYVKEVNSYSDGNTFTSNTLQPFNAVIFLFLFFGIFFFGGMSHAVVKKEYKKFLSFLSIICLISLPIYLYPYFNDILYGAAAGFIGLTVIFGWFFIILVICALCSIFIK